MEPQGNDLQAPRKAADSLITPISRLAMPILSVASPPPALNWQRCARATRWLSYSPPRCEAPRRSKATSHMLKASRGSHLNGIIVASAQAFASEDAAWPSLEARRQPEVSCVFKPSLRSSTKLLAQLEVIILQAEPAQRSYFRTQARPGAHGWESAFGRHHAAIHVRGVLAFVSMAVAMAVAMCSCLRLNQAAPRAAEDARRPRQCFAPVHRR